MPTNSSPIFPLTVDYDDPAWRDFSLGRVSPDRLDIAVGSVSPAHFPITRTGSADIALTYLDIDYDRISDAPTTSEVLAAMARGHLRPPDRAEVETFLRAYRHEVEHQDMLVALCGAVVATASGSAVASVTIHQSERPDGRIRIDCRWQVEPFGNRWDPYRRFIAVRTDT